MDQNGEQAVERGAEIAAIDLGSNSFHLVLGRDEGGQARVLDRIKERVSLAEGLRANGTITPAAKARALDCLARFGQRLQGMDPNRVRAAGTNTFRSARDGGAFLEQASLQLGFPIDIVSGSEEARLVYTGVRFSSGFYKRKILCVDIGGGSTELALGRGRSPRLTESLRVGHVPWTERFFPDGRVDTDNFAVAVRTARLAMRSVARTFREAEAELVVGSSGTALAIAAVIEAMGWDRGSDTVNITGHFSRGSLERLRDELIASGGNTAGFKELADSRRDRFAAGVAIMLAVFDSLRIESMVVSDGALREGLLSELVGRLNQRDGRDATVLAKAERFSVDMEQAGRVASTAALLFEATRKPWGFRRARVGLLLRWAALLHEIGLSVSHDAYRRHGNYLIANADLPGFSRNEQERLGKVVYCQRGRLRPELFEGFRKDLREELVAAVLLLRVARIMHRSRSSRPLPAWGPVASRDGEQLGIALGIPEDWRRAHRLVVADLELERGQWAALGHVLELGVR
ncbi:MAG: Ppx/GppA phosphatase family protein [Planctomycetota bacterium]|nr:Ppx/GppA phosphatase family protein [Planctomycetota bacterium]